MSFYGKDFDDLVAQVRKQRAAKPDHKPSLLPSGYEASHPCITDGCDGFAVIKGQCNRCAILDCDEYPEYEEDPSPHDRAFR